MLSAQQGQARPCETVDRGEAVVLLLCETGTTDAQWSEAGREACAGDDDACNAWIWLDAALVPESAPESDAELPKDRSGKAVAIWVDAAESLILVRPVAADATR